MEFFGITVYGPQNPIADMMKDKYKTPMNKEAVTPLMENIKEYSTLPKSIQRPDVDVIRVIDLYIGRVNGFSYGSSERFKKMKRKGVMLPPFPCDMYRYPPTSYSEAISLWKALPLDVRMATSRFTFKVKAHEHIRKKLVESSQH